MASQALYRRYRSQTFDELVGQEHIVQTLRNAVVENRIAHAYLFTGPRGVGKTSGARLLAKAVNCTEIERERPCGVCDACVSIAEGRAVDVIEMDAASHTSVEDAREIIERVQFRPSLNRYKVYIIDEVHMLSTAAFNALLKTLEEPPGHALFIMATTEAHKVPATILSRCQRFTFNRHSITMIANHLHQIATQEQLILGPGVAEAIARAATGSMRDALSLLDQLMAYGGKTIGIEQVQHVIGATQAQEVSTLIDALIDADVTQALQAVASVADQGADLRQFTRDLVERLRAVMLIKAGGDTNLVEGSDDELASLVSQSQASDLGTLLNWVKLFSSLDYQIRTSAIPQLPLEMAVVEALIAPTQPINTIAKAPTPKRALSTPVKRTAPAPTPAPKSTAPEPSTRMLQQAAPPTPKETPPAQPATASPDAVEPTRTTNVEPPPPTPETPVVEEPAVEAQVDEPDMSTSIKSDNAAVVLLEEIEQIWPDVVRDVRVHNKTLQALLNSGVHPIDVQEDVIVLGVASDFLFGRLDQPQNRAIVEQVIHKITSKHYYIRCVVEAQHRENPNELREQIRNARKDPLVKAAINIFDADIVAVEDGE